LIEEGTLLPKKGSPKWTLPASSSNRISRSQDAIFFSFASMLHGRNNPESEVTMEATQECAFATGGFNGRAWRPRAPDNVPHYLRMSMTFEASDSDCGNQYMRAAEIRVVNHFRE
jgi:hypothetical protein